MRIDPKKIVIKDDDDGEICLVCGKPDAFEGLCDKCYMEQNADDPALDEETDFEPSKSVLRNRN